MIKAVIFDMDGVMIDTERQSNLGWQWGAKQKGIELPNWLMDEFKGASPSDSAVKFKEYFGDKADFWEVRELRTQFVYKLRETEGVPVKKGLFELLDFIKEAGLKCAVATSTRRESAFKNLTSIGAYDYLDGIAYGDEIEHSKPAPDIFLKAAGIVGVKPEECIVIEDSINGIKAGHAANMKVVHVPDTIKIKEDIRELCYCVKDDLSQVIDVIKELNQKA